MSIDPKQLDRAQVEAQRQLLATISNRLQCYLRWTNILLFLIFLTLVLGRWG